MCKFCSEDHGKASADCHQHQCRDSILDTNDFMVERNVEILFPTRLIFMMLGCVDPSCPLHPVPHNSHPENEGNIAYQRTKYPGRFTKEKRTKYGLASK